VSLAGSTMALRDVNVVTHFTHLTVAHAHHGVYTFFTMIMFGSIYFMMPRLLYREWPSAALIGVHFWTTALGGGMYVVGLHLGGWIQGMEMLNAEIPFDTIVGNTVPWLFSRSLAGILLTVGHVAFAINIFWMMAGGRGGAGKPGEPTLLGRREAAGA